MSLCKKGIGYRHKICKQFIIIAVFTGYNINYLPAIKKPDCKSSLHNDIEKINQQICRPIKATHLPESR